MQLELGSTFLVITCATTTSCNYMDMEDYVKLVGLDISHTIVANNMVRTDNPSSSVNPWHAIFNPIVIKDNL